jgi:hypothetical protein
MRHGKQTREVEFLIASPFGYQTLPIGRERQHTYV